MVKKGLKKPRKLSRQVTAFYGNLRLRKSPTTEISGRHLEPKLDGFKRFLRFWVAGSDVSLIVMEQKWPSRDVVKTSFVDRGQSSAILDGDHHSENKDRSYFSNALFATQGIENSVLQREQPRRTRRARRGSSTSFRIARSPGSEPTQAAPTT